MDSSVVSEGERKNSTRKMAFGTLLSTHQPRDSPVESLT